MSAAFEYRGYSGLIDESSSSLYIPKGHVLYGKKVENFPYLSKHGDIICCRSLPLTPLSCEEIYEIKFAAGAKMKDLIDEIITQIEIEAAKT